MLRARRRKAVFVTAGHAPFRPLDRNERARLLFRAEALDRRTRLPGQHGGCLKRTGLAVLRALLFSFANVVTGRCDPSFDALARAAGVARSTVAVALGRLEAAGLIERVRRLVWVGAGAHRRPAQASNAYAFVLPDVPAPVPGADGPGRPPGPRESSNRALTTTKIKTNQPATFEDAAGWCAESPAEARAALRADYEAIIRNRTARQAQRAQPAAAG